MTEKDSTGKVIEVAERLTNSAGLGEFGIGIGFGLAMVAFFLLPPLVMFASQWDGHFHDRRGCVQLQEISEVVYKVDSCTGKTELLNP